MEGLMFDVKKKEKRTELYMTISKNKLYIISIIYI